MAGFSTSTGYRVERDPRLPSRKKACHGHGGGRPDPLTDIWDSQIVPLLERTPDLRPITIFEEMIRRHPERDLGSARRTLERRVRLWKARFGPQQEVIFRQEHPPGRQGMSDFFDANSLAVTIAGEPLAHRIYHFTLVYSQAVRSLTQCGEPMRFAMAAPIDLRNDFDSVSLRRLAKRTRDATQSRRLLALAEVYDGGSRTDASRIGGVGLQIIRDWVSTPE